MPESVPFPSLLTPADLVKSGVNSLTADRLWKETQRAFLRKAFSKPLTISIRFLNDELDQRFCSASAASAHARAAMKVARGLPFLILPFDLMASITPESVAAFLTSFHTGSYT